MVKWEYKWVVGGVDLAALGAQGWELVTVVAPASGPWTTYFKRPIGA
jgi:hypothetical protein